MQHWYLAAAMRRWSHLRFRQRPSALSQGLRRWRWRRLRQALAAALQQAALAAPHQPQCHPASLLPFPLLPQGGLLWL